VEIDRKRALAAIPPPNGKIILGCVFRHKPENYDACIGNPPYAQHHDIEKPWKNRTIDRLERQLGISLDRHCNLYIYFLCLGLLKTRRDGLVALVIPYEWVSRPAPAALREYIREKLWNVSVYRFQVPIFKDVLTTASITIIDKSHRDGHWAYYDITADHHVVARDGITDSKSGLFSYEDRGEIWALRGLSPGSQKIFTLTERQRVRFGLQKRDVVPCVTSLRSIPRSLRMLNQATFQKYFVGGNQKCWLIRSNAGPGNRSEALNAYLKRVPRKDRQTYTCKNQTPWFKYEIHPKPQILVSSGFTKFGPKVLVNSIGAQAVGSVVGIHSARKLPVRSAQTHLLGINFEQQIVAHAKSLKKIEIGQLNGILKKIL
jgi:hypothetical protein